MSLFRALLLLVLCLAASACAVDASVEDLAGDDEEDENVDVGQTTDALGAVPPYQWPIKPFDRQHPVRGFMNDPRQGSGGGEAFHFGIDVAAPDGTPVYAIEAGTLYLTNKLTLAIMSDGGKRTFAYYHMRHVFDSGDNRKHIAKGQLLGHIETGWGHVHIGEKRGSKWVNPLRRGGITPFIDMGKPSIGELTLSQRPARGKIDIIVTASDKTPVRVQDPRWDGMPVGVSLLRWRVLDASGGPVAPGDGDWIVGVDLRESMLDAGVFDSVFAPGTFQNHPNKPGTYNYFLSHGWDSSGVPNGSYLLEVEASDVRGNLVTKRFGFTVGN